MVILASILLCVQAQVRAELAVVQAPAVMGAGLAAPFAAAVTNAGPCGWPAGAPVNLAYHWVREDGTMAEYEGRRTGVPLPLGPGERVVREVLVTAPVEPGRYRLALDAVWERRFWVSDLPGPAFPSVAVEVRPSHLEVRGGLPLGVLCGSVRRLAATVRNGGPFPVGRDSDLYLVHRWRPLGPGPAPEETVLPLDGDWPPGAVRTVAVPLAAPARQGLYGHEWAVRGPAGVLARQSSRLSLASIRLSTLFWAGSALVLLPALLPAWRRRLGGGLGIVPWAWFVLSVGAKTVGAVEAAHGVPGARLAAMAAVSAGVLGLPFLLLRWRARVVALGVLNAAVSLVIIADLIYFRHFGDLPSAGMLGAAGQLGSLTESIAALAGRGVLFPLADLPVAAVLVWLALRMPQDPPPGRGWRALAAAAALALAVPLAFTEAAYARGEASGVYRQRFKNAFLAGRIGVVGYHAVDLAQEAFRAARDRARRGEDLARVRRWLAGPERAGQGPSSLHGAAAGMNVLVVQEESLEAWPLDCAPGGTPVMSFLRRVRGDCLEFTSFWDETGSGRTSDAELMLLTSLHPVPRGSAFFLHAGNRFHTLAHRFRESGYSTLYAHPHDPGFWNRAPVYAGFGFDRLLFGPDFRPGRTIGWGLANEDFFDQAVEHLARMPRPFFAVLVTLTDHHPYQDLPVPPGELPLGALEGTMPGRYLKVCREKDRALETLARRLGDKGLLDRTVLAVYGDHGAGLDWTAATLEAAGLRGGDALGWYEMRRLPLLIHLPGAAPAAVPKSGGHTDLGPTLLDLAGIDGMGGARMGRSLLAPGGGLAVFPDASFRSERLRLERWGLSGGSECWDLETRTRTDIARCRPDHERALERLEVSAAVLRADLMGDPAYQRDGNGSGGGCVPHIGPDPDGPAP
jgi:phosphoglycerol transferase MdoB-like AlkP superfamily enzyme